MQDKWAATQFSGEYADAKQQSADFQTYKQSTKRTWVTEKQDVATLFGNVQTKLRTYKLREYVPPAGLSLSVRLPQELYFTSASSSLSGSGQCVEDITGRRGAALTVHQR